MRKLLILLTIMLLCSTGSEARAAYRYKVKVTSTPPGASIFLEGNETEQGKTPTTLRLTKGQYTLTLRLEGYKPASKTVVLSRNATFDFTLEKKPDPATFSIEASPGGSADGATVKVNGKEVGKVPVTVALLQGRYLVEVAKDGFKKWEQWIDVQQSEKRSIVVSLVAEAPDTGSLLVSSNVTGATVFVDGKKMDTAPALVDKLEAGTHIVEVQAAGYVTLRKDITVEAGKTAKLTLDLELDKAAVAASTGTIQVLAEPKGVEILVDGASNGLAPVKVEELAEGTHLIEGTKEGYDKADLSVEIKKGEFKTVKLTLKEKDQPQQNGNIVVSSNVKGATVYLDGKDVGKTPLLQQNVVPGPHVISVRNEGYDELYKTVLVKAGENTEVQADLKVLAAADKAAADKAAADKAAADKAAADKAAAAAGKDAADKDAADKDDRQPTERTTLGLSSYGAQLVGRGYFTADISGGFPYFFEGRLTTGVWEMGHFGIDAGIDFRTFGQYTEGGAHANVRVLYFDPFAVSINVDIGGGGGPDSKETFYTNIGLNFSIWFKRMVTFTGRLYTNIYVDDLCDSDPTEPGQTDMCKIPPDMALVDIENAIASNGYPGELKDQEFRDNMRGTFSGVRFLMAAIIEVPITDMINIFAIFEGAPGQSGSKGRWAFRDAFNSVMPDEDYAMYGRLGATIKF